MPLTKRKSMNWENLLSTERVGKDSKNNATESRSIFEQDFDRIIFSKPFRRLQDKTQVHPLPVDEFVHNRLTHSLEVSSVGRSLGRKVGEKIVKNPLNLRVKGITSYDFGAIVAAAALAHDIGNPPFGHSGESAISEFFKNKKQSNYFGDGLTEEHWQDLTNFEGNAQGFRLMIQAKELNLTYATLGAFSKYPCSSSIQNREEDKVSQKKYSYFQSEKQAFAELAGKVGLEPCSENGVWSRHPLAFLVEAADDICYLVIDLEDGCRLGLVSSEDVVRLLGQIIGENHIIPKIDDADKEKKETEAKQIGYYRARAINVLIDQCAKAFIENIENILEGSFDSSLTDIIDSKSVLKKIKELSVNKIYNSQKVVEREVAGFEVLPGLLESFVSAVYLKYFDAKNLTKKHETFYKLLPEEYKNKIKNINDNTKEKTDENTKENLYNSLLTCVDFVSGMTDTHALLLFRKIKGMYLSL